METPSYGVGGGGHGGGPVDGDAQVWDRARTVRLIELWSQSPALFDSTCPDYRDKYQRTAALNAIASDLGLQDSEIRDKMRNLRSQYAREKTHEQKSKLSPSLSSRFAYKSKWFYFGMLSFLDDFKRHVRSDSGSSRSHVNAIGNPDLDSIYSYQASLTPGTDGGQDAGLDPDCAQSPTARPAGMPAAACGRSLPPSPAYAAAAAESPSRSDGSDCGESGASVAAGGRSAPAGGRNCGGGGLGLAGALGRHFGGHTGAKKRKMSARKLVRCSAPVAAPAVAVEQLSRAASENGFSELLKEEPESDENGGEDEAIDAWTERLAPPVRRSREANDADEEDDEEIFGRFIASELRKVASVRLKVVAKLRMHEALLAATAARWERDGPDAGAAAVAATTSVVGPAVRLGR